MEALTYKYNNRSINFKLYKLFEILKRLNK